MVPIFDRCTVNTTSSFPVLLLQCLPTNKGSNVDLLVSGQFSRESQYHHNSIGYNILKAVLGSFTESNNIFA